MNNNRITLLALLTSLFFSCKEEPPAIDFTPTIAGLIDTSYINSSPDTVQARVVLLEESTGVQCIFCPNGHREGSRLDSIYPGQIALVYLHNGSLSDPYPESLFNFRTNEAEEVMLLLGGSSSQPAGAVNRKIHSGQSSILVAAVNSWAAFVASEVVIPPLVNVEIETRYQVPNLISKVTLQFNEDLTVAADGSALISLFITESGIVDYQLDLGVLKPNYIHNHALRAMMGSSSGNVMIPSKVAGRTVIKEYAEPLNSAWNLDNLNVVAVVHRDGSSSKEVLQAAESNVQ